MYSIDIRQRLENSNLRAWSPMAMHVIATGMPQHIMLSIIYLSAKKLEDHTVLKCKFNMSTQLHKMVENDEKTKMAPNFSTVEKI